MLPPLGVEASRTGQGLLLLRTIEEHTTSSYGGVLLGHIAAGVHWMFIYFSSGGVLLHASSCAQLAEVAQGG